MRLLETDGWPLIRFIIPAFPEVNIFTRAAKNTTPLGPVCVATVAGTTWGWRVEIIDENNYRGPRDTRGLPDHVRLQKERPASVAGFYCGLTSTMDRVFDLSAFYRECGVVNIAGGWHAHYCPEEALQRNIDIVVHGDGEVIIRQLLAALQSGGPLSSIPGISYLENGCVRSNAPLMLELANLNELPYPDFGLLRHARRIKTYPIGRVRGCRFNCEFCSVRGKPRWACAAHLFNTVTWLVETRDARAFFIVDDRLEENLEGISDFFTMIYERYHGELDFTVQIRLETARNLAFLETMKKGGVTMVAVGYESPIDEDLKAMRKGYLSRHMAEWTHALRRHFWVHGMFIFGYPAKRGQGTLGVPERVRRFKSFIREAQISSIQVLHPVPIVGTDLRARLMAEKRIFPLDVVPWSRYDGNYACFVPENMTLSELQETPIKLMRWFYSRLSLFRIPLRTLAFPVHYLVRGWHHWRYGWIRDLTRYGGYRLLRRWQKAQRKNSFMERLMRHRIN
ncbi:MAG: hypothetical protein AAB601_00070 [Patescibacteria group bacterium]